MTATPASHVYYFDVGAGSWAGTFTFKVTSWRKALAAGIGVKNLLFDAAMAGTQRVVGGSHLTSVVVPHPDEGVFGVVDNDVRLTNFTFGLYSIQERYLALDDRNVRVVAHEHFGPVPGILTRTFEYPAEIRGCGLGSIYHMPLLGSPWTATYEIGPDQRSLAGTSRCNWAEASERATRESGE